MQHHWENLPSFCTLLFFSVQPEAVCQSTTVVQQFSCCCVAPRWRYPLSLVEHLHTTRLSEPDGVTAGESRRLTRVAVRERHSHLPQALPLTCPSPHLHRSKINQNTHQNCLTLWCNSWRCLTCIFKVEVYRPAGRKWASTASRRPGESHVVSWRYLQVGRDTSGPSH